MATTENSAKKPQRGYQVKFPFKCTTPVHLRFTDIDVQGHVNNSIYLVLFDTAKVDYFRQADKELMDENHVNVMIANVNCDFLAQTRINEPVAVQSQIEHIGGKSFRLVQQLINTDTLEVKAIACETMVYFDPVTRVPAVIPQIWRDRIAQFEGHPVD